MQLIQENGYWWPACEGRSYRRYVRHANDFHVAMQYCKETRIAVQAGGHCGVWPKKLAEYFGAVYTFEPDMHNFKAMMANITEENIFPARGVLGHSAGFVGLNRSACNSGGHHVKGEGLYPVYAVDDFNFPYLDAIFLDIEGYELRAIQGAEMSIAEHKPVIMLENNGNSEKKCGIAAHELREYLEALGYYHKDQTGVDEVWLPVK